MQSLNLNPILGFTRFDISSLKPGLVGFSFMLSFAVRDGLGNSTKICLMVLYMAKLETLRDWLWGGESEQDGWNGMMDSLFRSSVFGSVLVS